jgi:DNA-binding MarR family transcriptional regulator
VRRVATELENAVEGNWVMNYNLQIKSYSDGDRDYALWNLFSRSMYAANRAREKEFLRYHISPEQSEVIFVAKFLKGLATQAEISRYLIRQPHTVASIVNRMEEKGLVEKVRDLKHKNMFRVVITEKGEKAYAYTNRRITIHRLMNSLSDNEKRQFGQYLEKIMAVAKIELGLDGDGLPPSE